MSSAPWIQHYDKGVPSSLHPYPDYTLIDIISRRAVESPDGKVMHFKGASMTWSDLDRQSNALAHALLEEGIAKGDRVVLVLPNSPQMIVCQAAIWKIGAVAVPVNPLYTEHELGYALDESGAALVIVLSPFYRKIKSAMASRKKLKVIVSNIKEYLPPLKKLLFTLIKEKKEGHFVTLDEGDRFLDTMMRSSSGESRPDVDVGSDDTALFLFSGGTTGMPKCAVCTHRSIMISGVQIAKWFGVVVDQDNEVVVLNMPLFHVYAQVGILGAAFVDNLPFVLVPNPRDIDDLISTLKKYRPSILPGVPTLFNALARHPAVIRDSKVLSSLKLCISGSAPLLLKTKKRFEEMTGGRIIDAYALTESMIASVLTPVYGTYKEGSVGIPAPDIEVRIVDQDNADSVLQPGEIGEVTMRAPQLMKGYWNRPDETEKIIRNGWLQTGDLGYLDEDGYLFIMDRKKDVIKQSGFQVWPREVEEVIVSHPDVSEAGVAGVPDEYQGEAVKAWVVLRQGAELDADELRSFCKKELAAYKVPKQIVFVDVLPKSSIGKVLRRKLVEEHTAEAS